MKKLLVIMAVILGIGIAGGAVFMQRINAIDESCATVAIDTTAYATVDNINMYNEIGDYLENGLNELIYDYTDISEISEPTTISIRWNTENR